MKKLIVLRTPKKTNTLRNSQDEATQRTSPRRSARLTPVKATTLVHGTNDESTDAAPSSPPRSGRLTPMEATTPVHVPNNEATNVAVSCPRRSGRLTPMKPMTAVHVSNDEGTNAANSSRIPTTSAANEVVPPTKVPCPQTSVRRVSKKAPTRKAPTSFQLRDEVDPEHEDASPSENEARQVEVRRTLDLMAETHGQEENSGGGSPQQEQTGSSSQGM